MKLPSYTLTHLLLMLLFKTCLGSHIFEISCVSAFLSFLGDTLSQHIFWSFDFSVFLPLIPRCSLSLSYRSCIVDLSGMSGHHTFLWDEKAPKVFSRSFHSVGCLFCYTELYNETAFAELAIISQDIGVLLMKSLSLLIALSVFFIVSCRSVFLNLPNAAAL